MLWVAIIPTNMLKGIFRGLWHLVRLMPSNYFLFSVITSNRVIVTCDSQYRNIYFIDERNHESFVQAITDPEAYVAENGPFDGLMAFSNGASLGASVLVHKLQQDRIQQHLYPLLKFAVLFCGGILEDPRTLLQQNLVRLLDPQTDGEAIGIPTAHIWGVNDTLYPNFGPDLCRKDMREEYKHHGWHEITGLRDKVDVINSVRVIRRTIERALAVQ